MEQDTKYVGPHWFDDFDKIRPLSEFNSTNPDIAKQLIGHRWPDGEEFHGTDTIMEISRAGDRPFAEGDAVVGAYASTKQYQLRMAPTPDGDSFEMAMVPFVRQVLEQRAAVSPEGSVYMWAKAVVRVYQGIPDPDAVAEFKRHAEHPLKQEEVAA